MIKQVGEVLKAFPKYILGWVVGLIAAILSDLHITTLAVSGIAVGIASHSIAIGVAAFFVLYSVSRIASYVSDSIGFGTRAISISLSSAADQYFQRRDVDESA